MTDIDILNRYWRARREFESALRAAAPLLKLGPDQIARMIADIDTPGIEVPGPGERRDARKLPSIDRGPRW